MIFRIFGIHFEFSVPFAVMLAFLLVTDSTGLMSASLLAVTMHEIGHLVAMRLTKCLPTSIKCGLGGILISGNSYCTKKQSLLISASGPLMNLILTAVMLGLGWILNNATLCVFSAVQFLVGSVNLLPIRGLDGGDILKNILFSTNIRNVGFWCSLVSIVAACIVFVLGLAVAVKNVSNPSLLLLGIYLIIENIIILGWREN